MIEAGLESLQTIFSRRFIVGTFFPLLLFTVAVTAVALEASGRPGRVLDAYAGLPGVTQVILFAGGVLVLATIAQVTVSFQLMLTRLYEGYWPDGALFGRLRTSATKRQRTRFDQLSSSETAARESGRDYDANGLQLAMLQAFPPPTRLDALMPTRLGNVLRAAEIYPHERYGIDSVVIWPRLRHLLPAAVADGLVEVQTALESLLLLSTLAAIFGLITPMVLITVGSPWWLVAATLTGLIVTWISHRSAVQAAKDYADRIRSTFDLYRLDLLRHLEIGIPKDLAGERLIWDDLTQFYFRNLPYGRWAAGPPNASSGPSTPAP